MTSKRPVTHPALQRAYSTHQSTGRGEGADAADGRTAVLIGAVQAAAQAITEEASAGWRTCTPLGFANALADAGLLRDDAADEWRAELVAIVRTVREQNDRLTRERDDLLEAVKPANDYALRKGYTTFSGGVDRVRHEVGLLARDIALAEERAERAERERDDLLAMKARAEALHTPVEVHEYDDTNGVFVVDEAGDHVVTCLLCAECTTDEVLEALGDCDWREGDGVEFPCSTIEAIRDDR